MNYVAIASCSILTSFVAFLATTDNEALASIPGTLFVGTLPRYGYGFPTAKEHRLVLM